MCGGGIMTSFKDFLKEKASYEPAFAGKVVSVKDLGEWALNETIERIKLKKSYKNFIDFLMMQWDYPAYYVELAVACLGEAEVKKRLKKLEARK